MDVKEFLQGKESLVLKSVLASEVLEHCELGNNGSGLGCSFKKKKTGSSRRGAVVNESN